jgi:hypothetical protein
VALIGLLVTAACGFDAGASAPATPGVTASATPAPTLPPVDLPDLQMDPLRDFAVETTDDGRRLLRFTATIINVGDGPMEVWAERDGDALREGVQRVYDDDGEFVDIPTDATFFWAGDGHDHWHVRDMQGYHVEALEGGDATAVSEKHGFCLFDNYPLDEPIPGAPDEAAYQCPGHRGAARIEMGLSVGWRDVYSASLPNQYIDITELPAGRYRLWAEADPVGTDRSTGWFVESDETNNVTWVDFDLELDPPSVRVVGEPSGLYGPWGRSDLPWAFDGPLVMVDLVRGLS